MTSDLSSLLVSQQEVASTAIVESLQGIVRIGKTSGDPMPTAEFKKLDKGGSSFTGSNSKQRQTVFERGIQSGRPVRRMDG